MIFIIIIIFILFTMIPLKTNIELFEGCRNFKGRIYDGTVPVCMNKEQSTCYSFYDNKGDLHSPCGMNEINKQETKENCENCSKHCQYCINKYKKGNCISRQIFNCKLCPYSELCIYKNQA